VGGNGASAAAPAAWRRAGRGAAVAAGPLALAAFVALAHAPALRQGFVYDDRILIVEAPAPRSARELASVFAERHWFNLPYYRPLARVTMVWQKGRHGNDPPPYHAFNLALGAVAALLLTALLREPALGIARGPALVAAALFAAHPVAADCIYPISSGRETLLPVVFSLAALLAWLRPGRRARALALASFAAALLAKEQAALVPAILALADALGLSADPPGRSARSWARRYAPVAAVLLAYAILRSLVVGAAGLRLALFAAPLSPLWSLVYALQTTFAPFAELVYEPRLAVWLSPRRIALALAAAALLAVAAARAEARLRRAALFFAGLALVGILPTANVFAQEAPFAERYGLLALAGVAGVAAAAASARPPGGARRAALAVGLALAVAAAALSRARAPAWADDLAFHTQWLRSDPEAAQPHVGLGQWFAERGSLELSLAHYEAAIALRPDYAVAHASLGALLLAHDRSAEAAARLERAAALAPREAATWSNLGVALARLGRRAEAEAALARALDLDPDLAAARRNLAALRAGGAGVAPRRRRSRRELVGARAYTRPRRPSA
jgi:Tfp pilus assembly protein PilF